MLASRPPRDGACSRSISALPDPRSRSPRGDEAGRGPSTGCPPRRPRRSPTPRPPLAAADRRRRPRPCLVSRAGVPSPAGAGSRSPAASPGRAHSVVLVRRSRRIRGPARSRPAPFSSSTRAGRVTRPGGADGGCRKSRPRARGNSLAEAVAAGIPVVDLALAACRSPRRRAHRGRRRAGTVRRSFTAPKRREENSVLRERAGRVVTTRDAHAVVSTRSPRSNARRSRCLETGYSRSRSAPATLQPGPTPTGDLAGYVFCAFAAGELHRQQDRTGESTGAGHRFVPDGRGARIRRGRPRRGDLPRGPRLETGRRGRSTRLGFREAAAEPLLPRRGGRPRPGPEHEKTLLDGAHDENTDSRPRAHPGSRFEEWDAVLDRGNQARTGQTTTSSRTFEKNHHDTNAGWPSSRSRLSLHGRGDRRKSGSKKKAPPEGPHGRDRRDTGAVSAH